MSVQSAILSGNRLHLQHGPIDLVIGADGARDEAFRAAAMRFETILQELMQEIASLRAYRGPEPAGPVARRMWRVVRDQRGFVTPMAAVAGAVADEVLQAMQKAADLRRAYVNNGGDIALHLQGDATFEIAMASEGGSDLGRVTLRASDLIGGIATSGRGGRSLSMGIAESVTVLAASAAVADVAATLICNAVDLPRHPAISRVPAHEIDEASDLGERLVVAHVGRLDDAEVAEALERGARTAMDLLSRGAIASASLHLAGQCRTVCANKGQYGRENNRVRSLVHA